MLRMRVANTLFVQAAAGQGARVFKRVTENNLLGSAVALAQPIRMARAALSVKTKDRKSPEFATG